MRPGLPAKNQLLLLKVETGFGPSRVHDRTDDDHQLEKETAPTCNGKGPFPEYRDASLLKHPNTNAKGEPFRLVAREALQIRMPPGSRGSVSNGRDPTSPAACKVDHRCV
jgi:hypothetical protein